MKSLQQLANEGILFKDAESELIKQNLFAVIKDASISNAFGRQLVDVINMTQGSTLDFILADKNSTIVRQVSEGGEIPIDVEAYTKIQITPSKFGTRLAITKEMIEDSNWPLLERNLREVGRQMSIKETNLVFTSFNDSTNGFPSNAAHDITSASTELGVSDITNAMSPVEAADYAPDVMALHPTQVNELRQLDTFVTADKVGDRRVFEMGWVGRIFGLDTMISSLQTADTVHVFDKKEAGVLVIRRPMTVERWKEPLRDLENAAITQRMAARVLRATAGARITVS
ncbi:MAG TPA: phage major capsid protein [Nitrosopumilus sp.]|nr:phage major capsid protein [Nitrosopumilus sp.]